jgi:hypothetical protein
MEFLYARVLHHQGVGIGLGERLHALAVSGGRGVDMLTN